MAVSKRIQVLLKPLLTEAVENLAETQGETLSRMTAILVEEALTARGLNPKLTNYLPPEIEDSIQREATASERGWKPKDGLEALYELTPEWEPSPRADYAEKRSVAPSTTPTATPEVAVEHVSTNTHKSDEAQLRVADDSVAHLKLKLMQELMEQLKSM